MIWKVEAEGDTVYLQGGTMDEAENKFRNASGFVGFVPKTLGTWTEVSELPAGEEFIEE